MAGEQTYIRVPPDSTGKKIRHRPFLRLQYSNLQNNHIWHLDGHYTVTGSVSMNITVFKGGSGVSGYVGAIPAESDIMQAITPVAGDEIYHEGQLVATIVLAEYIHVPTANIVGGDSPHNAVNVDSTGSMNIRFAEGLPQLDAFGKLRVSMGTTIGDYIFANDVLPGDFKTRQCGNGTVSFNDRQHCLLLTVPGNQAPGIGIDDIKGMDRVCHTTNTYHHYFPGNSQNWLGTVALSDDGVGRPDVVRRWGYYDDRNGIFFQYHGTELAVVIRSDTEVLASEMPEEIIITRTQTIQRITTLDVNDNIVYTDTVLSNEGWNGDPVDGTGDSQFTLSVLDDNLYWIDMEWLGAGRIRFGCYHNGQRITMHEYYHEGNGGKPHIASGSLPITFSIENTSTIATDASMKAWCTAVHTEHQVNMGIQGSNRLETVGYTLPANGVYENGAEYQMLGVLSPVITVGDNDHLNRKLYLPNYMEALAYHTTTGTEAYVEVEVYLDPIIGGGKVSWPINQDEIVNAATTGIYTPWMTPVSTIDPSNGTESYKADKAAAGTGDYTLNGALSLADRPKLWGGGIHVLATYLKGYSHQDLSGLFANFQDGAFKNYANLGGTEDHPVGAWTVSPDGSTATKYAAVASMGMLRHREGYPIRFYGVEGTASTVLNYDENGNTDMYIKIVAMDEAELYYDKEFTQPVLTNGLAVTTNGRMRGQYGTQMYFVVVAKLAGPSKAQVGNFTGDVEVKFNLGWSEINQ